jgi:low temperature requirement protein LtrA
VTPRNFDLDPYPRLVSDAGIDAEVRAEGESDVVADEKRVAPLELFFDLVFVFALTQVTRLMADTPTWMGLLRGMLVLSLLWWAWAAFSWLTNYVDTDRDRERLLLIAVMGAMLTAGLATPGAFGDNAVLFACAYALVRWLHIFVLVEANEELSVGTAIGRLARTALPAPALLIVASALHGNAQLAIWGVALAIDFAGPFVFGVDGFVVSAGHFAERFGLIVIIALGESIVAISAADSRDLDTGTIVAAVLGLVISAGLWWAYFDVAAVAAEHRFRSQQGYWIPRMARDAYSYLHLPMIAGIVLLALGLKKTILHVDEPLDAVIVLALFGGVALYLLAHVAFKWRVLASFSRPRLSGAIALVVCIPLALQVDAIVALGLVAAITTAVIAYEAIHYAEARKAARAGG